MATIGIDAHAIGGRLTGNETYIANLIDGLMGIGSGHDFVLFFTESEESERWRQRFPAAVTALVRPAQPLVRIPLVMPLLAKRHRLDLLHVQYVGPPLMRTPMVATIHDISFETHPEFFSRRELIQFKATFPMTARRARKVLTISEHSRHDLVEIYGLPEEKVVVVYLGAGKDFRPPESPGDGRYIHAKYGIGDEYVLTVGNLQPRKNLVRLVKAYTRMRDAEPDRGVQLVIVGQKAWEHDPILAFVRDSRWSDDIILTGYVPDDDLPALYGRASVFAYPSIYEGFGLPPLEAMACGTPVVVSDRTSLPEVVGDGGVQVDPYDIDAIAAAIATLLQDEDMTRHYREAGIRQAGRFSWERCARETLSVYESAMGKEAGP